MQYAYFNAKKWTLNSQANKNATQAEECTIYMHTKT